MLFEFIPHVQLSQFKRVRLHHIVLRHSPDMLRYVSVTITYHWGKRSQHSKGIRVFNKDM